ncbi:gamma-type small acid-soluble spore protein [Halobacillus naozhouensis]|uniref:Gamma-type small acid-soluble spore protein n=1 Tax=Halobacillus naozhouensis TaxID=554880 RepID=A0ABY8J474_9BACI|nr:gamma-type small acid-soluble spore protein [Halobacillus naozhouensis]WFT75560.1 gamma-type small acid-soluble spore protein [Halobacillus naozhouensis]
MKENDNFTVACTNIDEVKRKNEQSGMSYNEAKAFMAKTTRGHGTNAYSDTNIEDVKSKNQNKK